MFAYRRKLVGSARGLSVGDAVCGDLTYQLLRRVLAYAGFDGYGELGFDSGEGA